MKVYFKDRQYHIRPFCCNYSEKFPLFINFTNFCNAKCAFCINQKKDTNVVNVSELKLFLDEYSSKISSVSISGGEPLLYLKKLNELFKILKKYDLKVSINTNGFFLERSIKILNKYKLSSIQISIHHYNDEINNSIFKVKTIGFDDLKKIKSKNKYVINCLLIKNYIDSYDEVINYLEQISEIDVAKVNFISMMQVNEFTKDNFIDYRDIISHIDSRFSKIKDSMDGKRCSCSSYLYMAKNNKIIVVFFKHTRDTHHTGRCLLYDYNGLQTGY